MKQSLIILLFVLISSTRSFGQGTVSFYNGEVVGGNHLVYSDFVGGSPLVGTNFVAELYYGALGTDPSLLTPFPTSISPFKMLGTSSPGTWVGKYLDLPIGGVNVPLTLDVRVWDLSKVSTYESAVAARGALGLYGESGAFDYTQILSAPPDPTDTQMLKQPAFALVPEPGTIGLALVACFLFLVLKSARLAGKSSLRLATDQMFADVRTHGPAANTE